MQYLKVPFCLFIVLAVSATARADDVTVTIDYSSITVISAYAPGISQVDNELCFPWTGCDLSAVNNVKSLIANGITFVNQPIMAWGTPDPWPNPAQLEPTLWSGMDHQMQNILDTGATPVISLCEAPWWMKGQLNVDGTTKPLLQTDEWNSIAYSSRILDNKMNDWLKLVQCVAERYMVAPYNVRYFQVWNEFKGYYNPSRNHWDYDSSPGDASGPNAKHGYTYMYNLVYQRLKQTATNLGIDSTSINVGGPYIVMDSGQKASCMSNPSSLTGPWGVMDQRVLDAIGYWLQNKAGAEFISVDGANATKFGVNPTDDFTMTQKFSATNAWIRQQPGGHSLPIWWAEWYTAPSQNIETDSVDNALGAYSVMQQINSGASVTLLWSGTASKECNPPLWTDTTAGGGQPKPWYYTYKSFHDFIIPGTPLFAVHSSSSAVAVLASPQKIMVINTSSVPLSVSINGCPFHLADYEVKIIDRLPPFDSDCH